METLMAALIFIALCLACGFFGADSRPEDGERATRWWPAIRRD